MLKLASLIQVPLLSVTDGKLANSRTQVRADWKLATQITGLAWGLQTITVTKGGNGGAKNSPYFQLQGPPPPQEPTSLILFSKEHASVLLGIVLGNTSRSKGC